MRWVSALSEAKTLPQALEKRPPRSAWPWMGKSRTSASFLFPASSSPPTKASRPPFNRRWRRARWWAVPAAVWWGRPRNRTPAGAFHRRRGLAGGHVTPFRVADGALPDLDVSPRAWHQLAGVAPSEQPHFILLADPFSMRVDNLLLGLDYAFPKSVKVGGLASGATQPGENGLILNSVCYRSGGVGVALSGNIALDALVAQGCRPIGKPFRVTKCDRNILMELDGEPPLNVMRDLYQTLDARDQDLLQNALVSGVGDGPAEIPFYAG